MSAVAARFKNVNYSRYIIVSLVSILFLLSGCVEESHDEAQIIDEGVGTSVNEEKNQQRDETISENKSEKEESNGKKETSRNETIDGGAYIHFIDVGQGDATLLQGPDFTILIDAGRHDRNDVVPYLQNIGITKFDLVVGTHPHADHIGQLDKVLEAFPVQEVWMSGSTHTTRTFERVINAIIEHEVDYYEPRSGDEFQIGSLFINVINPVTLSGDLHEDSISLVATFGEVSFLFTGDAEKQTEEAMLQRNELVEADIFQLGHHGSSTSNIEKFLRAVDPDITIYSAGADNSYGHPHREVIERLYMMDIPVYGTVSNGTIIITTDGKTYTVDPEAVTLPKEENDHVTNSEDEEEKSPLTSGECIDINNASLEQLQNITQIGEERAKQLIELRPFSSINELTRINGIGSGRLREIKAEGKACVG